MEEEIKVLYVDDEPGLLEIARLFLEQAGNFQVSTATSAQDALDSPQIRSYDLIISDYQMPGMDGIAFLKEVRSRYGDIPFILFTGRGREEIVIEAINNGADFYLQKGGDPTAQFAELAHKIRQAVARKRAELSRRMAERDLRESEEKYRSLVDIVPLAVLVHREGKIVYANPECIRLSGAGSAEDLMGRELLPLIHPDDRAIALEHFRQTSTGAAVPLTEMRICTLDRRSITVEAAGKQVIYEGLPSVIVVYRDITDRKRGEEELRAAYEQITASEEELRGQYEELASAQKKLLESQQQLTGIAGTIPGVVYQFSTLPDGRMGTSFVSRRTQEIFGISNDTEGFVERFTAHVDSRDQDAFVRSIREAVSSGSPWDFEGRFIKPTGERMWFQGTSRPVEKDSGIVYNGVLLDITGRKKAEEAILAISTELQMIFRNMINAFVVFESVFDESGKYVSFRFGQFNDAYARIAKLNYEEVRGKDVFEVWPATELSWLEVYGRVATTGIPETFDMYHAPTRGWYHCNAYRPTASPDKICVIFEDITERKKSEEALRESGELLRIFIRHAPAALAMLDKELCYIAASRRWMADYHLGDRDLIGHSHYEIFPELTEEIKEVLRRGLAGEITSANEDRFERQDGSVQWLAWEVRPWYTTGNAIGGVIIFSEDITRRKTAEEALRESERNFRNLVENSQSIIYTLHPDGTFTFVSPSWKKHLGHEPAEVLGRNFRMFIHPDDIAMCEAFLEKTIAAGTMQVTNNDYRIFHKDGSIHWHRSSIMPILDEKGNLVSIVGNAVDFTDRKCAEDALQESRAELSSILNGSPALQFVIGRDHRVLSWNKALEKYSGIPATDVVGTDRQWRPFYQHQRPVLADLLVDDNTDGLFKWYAGKLQPSRYVGGAYEATDFFPAMGASGTWLSFTAAPIRNADGAIIGSVETLEDITERRDAEYALRESEEKYRRILENMQDAYIRTDENGIIAMVSPSAVCMYGYGSAEEMIGNSSECLYALPGQREAMLRKLQTSGGITDFTGNALRKDGATFPVSLNVQFIRDEEGRVRGTEGIVRDITERKSMEHVIREANRKLKLLNRLTRHDIANQLTMIQGFIQLAATKERDPVIAEYLSKIDAGSQTIHRQIEFMKTYQELGVHTPGWLRLDGTIAKAAGKEVVCSGTCTDIEIFSDPMLEKVFFNLFENAMRHGEHVTEISVRCKRAPDGLVIIVEDNGIGILPDEKEKIFMKGFGKNTGLGLFLAKEILAITGITIRETGEPGRGARFEMTVPRGVWRNSGERV